MASTVPVITTPTAPVTSSGNWIPGLVGSNVVAWQTANLTHAQLLDEAQAESRATERQASLAADNSLLRVVYGQPRIGAQIANILAYTSGFTSEWILDLVWAWGPIDSVNDFRYEGLQHLPSWALPSWLSVDTHYTGSGNTANALLTAAFAAQSTPYTYTDTLPNVAHSVVRAVSTALTNGLDFTARIKGRTVWDPRLSGGTGGTAWSANPALCLADFIESTEYGIGGTVDDDSLADAADWCDTLVGGLPRNTLSLVLAESRSARDWIEVLRTYAECFVVQSNGVYKLIPDKPKASVYTFSHASNNIAAIPTLYKKGMAAQPTLVTVGFTDTSIIPHREARVTAYASADIEDGTGPWRESFVSLPGIDNRDEAYRQAATRLNKHRLVDLSLTLNAFDEALQLEVGDVVTVTYPPYGITATLFQVSSIESRDIGRWTLNLVEYDENVYSDDVAPAEDRPDTDLPVPDDPDPVTGLTAAEELYQLADGTWASRVRAEWTASTSAYLSHYVVTLTQGADVIRSEIVDRNLATYASPPVQEGVLVQVDVQVVSATGAISTATSTTVTPLGKSAAPSNVSNFRGFEAGGRVFLYWDAVADFDIWRYEIRYGSTGTAWADATVLDRIDGLTYIAEGIASGTKRFQIKAVDSTRNYSDTAATLDVTISLDSAAFTVLTRTFTTPTLSNMTAYTTNGTTYYATNFGDGWGYGHDNTNNAVGTWNDSLVNTVWAHPHTSGTSSLTTESWDVGATVTGNVSVAITYTDVSGTATAIVQTSTDGSSWTDATSMSTRATFRYVRGKISTATSGTVIVTGPVTGAVTIVPKSETGLVNVAASGATTVTLSNKYANYTSVQLTVKGTTVGYFAVFDNVTLSLTGSNTFEVRAFDAAGAQVNKDVSWKFEGI